MNTVPLLAWERVSFGYPGRPALFDGLDFALRHGERIGLHGPNGCGKTTLLRLALGLETPSAGRILHRGEAVTDARAWQRLRCDIGFVMQHSDDQLFSVTVLEDVAFGPLNLGLPRREARDRAMETLDALHLADLADRAPSRLSGGEKKCVALASVLSMQPAALLLDEPTASLDEESTARVAEALRGLPQPWIAVSHDRAFLRATATSFARLDRAGRLESGLPLP